MCISHHRQSFHLLLMTCSIIRELILWKLLSSSTITIIIQQLRISLFGSCTQKSISLWPPQKSLFISDTKNTHYWISEFIFNQKMSAPPVEDVQSFHYGSSRLVFYPLLFLASTLWVLYRWQQQSRLFMLGNKIPGPYSVPLFGNALLLLGKKPDRKW